MIHRFTPENPNHMGPVGDNPANLAYHLNHWHDYPISDAYAEANFETLTYCHDDPQSFEHPGTAHSHTHLPEYIWPAANHPGCYVDAWNGFYNNYGEAMLDAPAGVGQPWVLSKGEDVVSEDEANRRRAHQAEKEFVEQHQTPAIPREYVIHEAIHEKLDTIIELLSGRGTMVLPGYTSVVVQPPNPAICPNCGPDGGIHVDADVRTRTAIMLESPNGSDPVVLVDRADGKAELLEIGIVECCRCGHEFDSEVFKNIVRDIVEDYQTTWRIMSDYRDM